MPFANKKYFSHKNNYNHAKRKSPKLTRRVSRYNNGTPFALRLRAAIMDGKAAKAAVKAAKVSKV